MFVILFFLVIACKLRLNPRAVRWLSSNTHCEPLKKRKNLHRKLPNEQLGCAAPHAFSRGRTRLSVEAIEGHLLCHSSGGLLASQAMQPVTAKELLEKRNPRSNQLKINALCSFFPESFPSRVLLSVLSQASTNAAWWLYGQPGKQPVGQAQSQLFN